MEYELLKVAHIAGAIVLLGTGAGIAFFMLMAHRTRDAHHIAMTARTVVVADTIFTATAVILQPITGYALARTLGIELTEPWLLTAIVLYVVAGLFWLPVVFMQIRMRDLAEQAASAGGPLPNEYSRLFRLWFLFGFPGFGAVAAILLLMIVKPY